MGLVGCSVAPRGLCSLCMQDIAALNPRKTLGLRSLFFQLLALCTWFGLLLGRMKNVIQVLMETRTSTRPQGYKEPPAHAAELCSVFGERYPYLLPWQGHMPPSSVEISSKAGFHRGGMGQ